jgi:spore coat protein A
MATRRQFLQLGLLAGAGLTLTDRFGFPNLAWAFYQSPPGIKKFTEAMRGVGPGGIPVAVSDGVAPVTGATHYWLRVVQYQDQLAPGLGRTTLWGYSPSMALGESGFPTRHLGGIIIAQRGTPVQLTAQYCRQPVVSAHLRKEPLEVERWRQNPAHS